MATSVQSNAQPAGGVTAQQPVPPSNAPTDLESIKAALKPAIERFREQSTPMTVVLPSTTFTQGAVSDGGVKLASVGLGYRTITEWTGTISIQNTATSAQVVNVSPWFPYNLISNTNVTINGGATVYSVGGLGGIMTAVRNRRHSLFQVNEESPFGPAISQALFRTGTITNATVTNSTTTAPALSGIASISVNASSTSAIPVTFYTFEKLAFDRDTLLGALPLQNNSTYALKTHTLNALGGGNNSFPFFVSGGIPASIIITISLTETTQYDFWSVPSDPGLYQEMVSNSYQTQEQVNQTTNAVGTQAFVYPIPQNMFLIALHIIARDGATTQVPLPFNGLGKRYLQYNAGSVVPVVQPVGQLRAAQYLDYDRDTFMIPGYFFWDGEDTTESLTNADQAGWVDCYLAAAPQYLADVLGTLTTPLTWSAVREQLVMGAVQVVGG